MANKQWFAVPNGDPGHPTLAYLTPTEARARGAVPEEGAQAVAESRLRLLLVSLAKEGGR